MSRYNPSLCDQQPFRRSQLHWPVPTLEDLERDLPPRPQDSQLQSLATRAAGTKSGRPTSRYPSYIPPIKAGKTTITTSTTKNHDSQCQPGVIGNPDALINRPKSAYTRNLRTTDEEPVFWQHNSHRATSRFRKSQFSMHRPVSVASLKQEMETRRSNASNFESLLDRTFKTKSILNLQPNPIINIEPPRDPIFVSSPAEDIRTSVAGGRSFSPNFDNPSFEISAPQKRFSGFRPLQLSFYLPGNRLSLLPQFSDDLRMNRDIPPVPSIARPASAVLKTRPTSNLSYSSTAHKIPRKAVASHTSSLASHSNRPSYQSSVTLVNETSPRESLHSRLQLDRTSWRKSNLLQSESAGSRPNQARSSLHRPAENVQRCSWKRTSVQPPHVETRSEEAQQIDRQCPAIQEECSPVSSDSPVSPLSPLSPLEAPRPSTEAYHEYDFTETRQHSALYQSTDYHDYEFINDTRHIPKTSEPLSRSPSSHVAPLFDSSASSADYSDNEIPPLSKPRSSSGSSTLYQGESSSDSDIQAVKAKLSVAFPSPTLQHRLSDWLSRSASQIQAFSPEQGECYGPSDSPTLGFSWKDFGFNAEKQTLRSDGGEHRRKKAFTDASSTTTYVNGVDEIDVQFYSLPGHMPHTTNVGVAF